MSRGASRRAQLRVLALAVWCAVFLGPWAAGAVPSPIIPPDPNVPKRVLPPAAGLSIERALTVVRPGLDLGDITIEGNAVRFEACRSNDASACLQVTLSDPEPACKGTVGGPWCLTFAPAAALDDVRVALTDALSKLTVAEVWQAPTSTAEADLEASRGDDARVAPWGLYDSPVLTLARFDEGLPRWAMALLSVLVPLCLGLLTGLVLRWLLRRRLSSAWLLGLAAVPFAAWLLVDTAVVPVGLADELLTFAWAALGLVLGARRPSKRRDLSGPGLAVASTLVSFALLEGVVHLVLPPPLPSASEVRFFEPPDSGGGRYFAEWICSAIYPEVAPRLFDARSHVAASSPRVVLHLGDAMAAGAGTTDELAYPRLLNGRTGDVGHVNAAIPTAGADHYLLILNAWLPRLPVVGVVVHFFPGNDPGELDGDSICCGDESWLVYDETGAHARCPSPLVGASTEARLDDWRGPFVLRLLAPHSWVVAHGLAALRRAIEEPPAPVDQALKLEHLRLILAAMKASTEARDVPLALAIVPYRRSFEAEEVAASDGNQLRLKVLAMARELNVPTLDPWDDFASAVTASGDESSWYAPLPDLDLRFNEKGDRWMADWFASRVLPALGITP